jgi:hypothetical protein
VFDVAGKPVQSLGAVVDGRADATAVDQVDDRDDGRTAGAAVQVSMLGDGSQPPAAVEQGCRADAAVERGEIGGGEEQPFVAGFGGVVVADDCVRENGSRL